MDLAGPERWGPAPWAPKKMDGNSHNDLISLLEPETSGAREAER
jgi:hypothetical protein